ncbi:redox-regulated ATPase YchF [bacterium DOLZORAL124_38_8]|nr:MAG: redox-regulated ATPase YchF [bacterium DOLZORAL124_38_8]
MNIKIGIVGLPNVGKSTLFNALTKSTKAAAENFPFCTIDPNVGIVEVPDARIDKLVEIVQPQKVQYSTIEFVDIAGLVEGASKGEGLGNQFLSHIRECSAIAHVVRAFDSNDIHHVDGSINPKRDLETIMTELILADLESANKQAERLAKKIKAKDKEAMADMEILNKIKAYLDGGKLPFNFETQLETPEELERFKHFHFLSTKKFMVIANVSEDEYASFDLEAFRAKVKPEFLTPEEFAQIPIVPICAKFEADLIDMDAEETAAFMEEIGAQKSGLENLAQAGFDLLGLQQYFTAGVKEVRSWTIKKGSTAPQAAGEIHTDFEKGFIKADTIKFEDFVAHGGEAGAKEAGKMKMEGKEYIVQDGDIMHFKFNV